MDLFPKNNDDLARQEEVQKLIDAFRSAQPGGTFVADLEKLLRTAIFKPAALLVGQLLQEAADKIDAAYQPKPGEVRKGRASSPRSGGHCRGRTPDPA